MHLNSEEGHNVKTIADVFFLSVVFLNDNFNTHTQMYWSKYSPWYIGNIVVGQVVVKCKLKPKAHVFAKNVNVIHLPMVFVIIPISLTSIFYNSRLIPEYYILVFGRNDK